MVAETPARSLAKAHTAATSGPDFARPFRLRLTLAFDAIIMPPCSNACAADPTLLWVRRVHTSGHRSIDGGNGESGFTSRRKEVEG